MSVSFGLTLDDRIKVKDLNLFELVTTNERAHLKLGLTTKCFNTIMTGGVKMGYRTFKPIEAGTSVSAENGLAFGLFHQTMFLISLPSEDWKLVLSGEFSTDFAPATFQTKIEGEPEKLVNIQAGFKAGVGVAYRVFGRM